jgi:hypothetical protein
LNVLVVEVAVALVAEVVQIDQAVAVAVVALITKCFLKRLI